MNAGCNAWYDLQDIVTRYASSTGRHVMRRFGWDCHGLPVEYEIDKKLSECGIDAECICVQRHAMTINTLPG